jgi:hypothetical protein
VPDRRGSRFVFEVLFLVALAVALTIAELRAVVIGGVMLLGWALVAGVEWAAWRDEPHYASGQPPRWYVPRVDLPPAQPLEAVVSGYPEGHRDEAATWIASPALRDEMLGEWPLAIIVDQPLLPEQVEPPAEPVGDVPADPVAEALTSVELPAIDVEPVPDPTAPAAVDSAPELAAERESATGDAPGEEEPHLHVDDVEHLDVELHRSATGVARYSLEPLAEQPPRRFGRGPAEAPPSIDVPARPEGVRALPGTAGED